MRNPKSTRDARRALRAGARVWTLALAASALWAGGCSEETVSTDGTNDEGDKAFQIAPQVITNFGSEYAVSRRLANGDVTTKLRSVSTQVLLLSLDWSIANGTFTYTIPGIGSRTGTDYSHGATSLEGSNVTSYMIYLNVLAAPGKDNPGCDGIPDYFEGECVASCCDEHDDCYAQNDCTAWSWLPFVGSAECDECNDRVVSCFSCCFSPYGGGPYGEPCN